MESMLTIENHYKIFKNFVFAKNIHILALVSYKLILNQYQLWFNTET